MSITSNLLANGNYVSLPTLTKKFKINPITTESNLSAILSKTLIKIFDN